MLLSWLRNLVSQCSQSSRQAGRSPSIRRPRHLAVECLEDRTVLAASVQQLFLSTHLNPAGQLPFFQSAFVAGGRNLQVVQSLYLKVLGRPASPAALISGVSFLARGGDAKFLEGALYNSPEYRMRHAMGINPGFFQALGRFNANPAPRNPAPSVPSVPNNPGVIARPPAPSRPDLVAASDTGASATDNITQDATPAFRGRAQAGALVTLYRENMVVGRTIARADGTYRLTVADMGEGAANVTATATVGGLTSRHSPALVVTIDNRAPIPSTPDLIAASDTGNNTDNFTSVTLPTFTGTVEAGSIVTLFRDGVAIGSGTAPNGNYSITSTVALSQGTHAITVAAKDLAGNVGTSGSLQITIDTEAPAAPSTPELDPDSDTSTPGDNITSVTTPTFTGTAEAGSTVTLFRDGVAIGSGLAAGGTYAITVAALEPGVHFITATATDLAGNTSEASDSLQITITFNNPPTAEDASFSVDEDAADGAVVGTVQADAQDAGQGLTYAITAGNAAGAFAIDPVTGEITVADATQLDFETTPSYTLTVTVTDDGDPFKSGTATILVNVIDKNDAPTAEDATFFVDEDAADGTAVGTVQANDQDVGQTLTYAITAGNAAGAFAIDPETGEITVADATQLDFETTPSYTLTITVTDDGDPVLFATATITINVTNNKAPTADDDTFAVDEDAAIGAVVGTVQANDPNAGQTLTYAITDGNEAGAFAIDPETGEITVASMLDFETTPSYTLTVTVTDDGIPSKSATATITITVIDKNDAPTASNATFNVDEDAADGAAVGTVSANDPDAGQSLTYAITAGDETGVFAIDPMTGAITVADATQLDFETTPSYTLTVTVTDTGVPPKSATATITINLTDKNDAPVVTNPGDQANIVGQSVNLAIAATDPDGNTLTYSASGLPGGLTMDPDLGIITGVIDLDAASVYPVTVTVDDGNGGITNVTFDWTVTVS